MFILSGSDVRGLRGGGGEPFTFFMDALIRVHCVANGVPDSAIDTTTRVTVPDGGVDTAVRVARPQDVAGWMQDVPTAWQYKSGDVSRGSLDGLVSGPAVISLIGKGYGFRLAIAESLPGDTRRAWEERLTELARQINPEAPPARVVTADDLASWASRYPGLVLDRFRGPIRDAVMHLEAWGAAVRGTTPLFQAVPEWEPVLDQLRRHLEPGNVVSSAVFTLNGDAGVGKTRAVFEVVSALEAASSRVVYCLGEDQALRVATALANQDQMTAVLVADDCDAATQEKLGTILAGARSRIRVITIDNISARRYGGFPDFRLPKMTSGALRQLLDLNFPTVPYERRRAYAGLAEGFPRLAADLCANDALVVRAGVGRGIPRLGAYLESRLGADQQEALEAVSVLSTVGVEGEVRGEIDLLCSWLGIDQTAVMAALREIQHSSGFVVKAGRYFYVTPELVAGLALDRAWQRWGRPNPGRFFDSVPPELILGMVERVERSASPEIRRAFADHCRDQFTALREADLADDATVHQLVQFTEVDPDSYLPIVERLIEGASYDALKLNRGSALVNGMWGGRRALVWMLEKLLPFPEYFDRAENILLRLAIAESEPDVTSNATSVWSRLFRIQLSGTPLSFEARLATLKRRVVGGDPAVIRLAGQVLVDLFRSNGWRTLGPAIVAGRILPREWSPRSYQEEQDAIALALAFISEIVVDVPEIRGDAVAGVLHGFRALVAKGFLGRVKALISRVELTDEELSELVEAIDVSVVYDLDEQRATPGAVVAELDLRRSELSTWRGELIGGSFRHRLVALVGKDRWAGSRIPFDAVAAGDMDGATSPFKSALTGLAAELLAEPQLLSSSLGWLSGRAARSAGELGELVGAADQPGDLLDTVASSMIGAESRAFQRGYLLGWSSGGEGRLEAVQLQFERLRTVDPTAAAELALSGLPLELAVPCVVSIYLSGGIPPGYLAAHNFAHPVPLPMPSDLQLAVLEALASRAELGDQRAAGVGIDNLALLVPYSVPTEPLQLLVDTPALVEVAWRLIDVANLEDPPCRWWPQVVVALSRFDPARSARALGRLLSAENFSVQHDAERAMGQVAVAAPEAAMMAIGEAMLDPIRGWRLAFAGQKSLIALLPPSIVKAWLGREGVNAARAIARSLQAPFLSAEGEAVVPELTEWVLETFEDDDRTCEEFGAGVHNLQLYNGGSPAEHEAEIATAERFVTHRLRRVREWAAMEIRSARENADRTRRWIEENDM